MHRGPGGDGLDLQLGEKAPRLVAAGRNDEAQAFGQVGHAPLATLALTERDVHLGGEAQVAPFVESLPARAKAA